MKTKIKLQHFPLNRVFNTFVFFMVVVISCTQSGISEKEELEGYTIEELSEAIVNVQGKKSGGKVVILDPLAKNHVQDILTKAIEEDKYISHKIHPKSLIQALNRNYNPVGMALDEPSRTLEIIAAYNLSIKTAYIFGHFRIAMADDKAPSKGKGVANMSISDDLIKKFDSVPKHT